MFIEIFFALANFAVLIGVLGYVGIRMVLPGFAQKLAETLRRRFSWRQNSQNLSTQLQEITQTGIAQERTYQTLEQKVALWHQSLELRNSQEYQNHCALNVSVHTRRQKQCTIFEAHKISARILPHALAEAKLELYEYYHAEDHGRTYIEVLVAQVEKSHD